MTHSSPPISRSTRQQNHDADNSEAQVLPPLIFQKRSILNKLTTSPEAANDAFSHTAVSPLEPSARSAPAYPESVETEPALRRSLLSSVLAGSTAATPTKAPLSGNIGILRKDADPPSASTASPDASQQPPRRPRLHFAEPQKTATTSRLASEPSMANVGANTAAELPTFERSATVPPILSSADVVIDAPKKRSLVIQEHADVLERAAERAARQTQHVLDTQSDHSTGTLHNSGRTRQHSMSSAGEETTSTRSSGYRRGSSRGSSVATSPATVVSAAADGYVSDLELKPAKSTLSEKPLAPQHVHHEPEFRSVDQRIAVDPDLRTGCSPQQATDRTSAARKSALTFVDVPEHSKRGSRRSLPPSVAGARKTAASISSPSSRNRDKACVSSEDDDDEDDGDDDDDVARRQGSIRSSSCGRRTLSFSHCPKPQRHAQGSPGHAHVRTRNKLSASPAPRVLPYGQRLKGIRGIDPVRSPAPHEAAAGVWKSLEDPSDNESGEGSGYSEDEEDSSDSDQSYEHDPSANDSADDDDDEEEGEGDAADVGDEDDDLDENEASSNNDDDSSCCEDDSGIRSFDRGTPASFGHASRSLHAVGKMPEQDSRRTDEIRKTADSDGQGIGSDLRADGLDADYKAVQAVRNGLDSFGLGPSNPSNRRRSSQPLSAIARLGSPPRTIKPRSANTSPRGSSYGRSKLKGKGSFSHPICFLPDTFDDSGPPTPSELESDTAYEPPRSGLVQGWLSEGGSASSSRRASWQQHLQLQQHQGQALSHQTSQLLPTSHVTAYGDGVEGSASIAVALPALRRNRGREGALRSGMVSEDEQPSSLAGGNAAFIRDSAGAPRSLPRQARHNGSRIDHKRSNPASLAPAPNLGASVPADYRPPNSPLWRQHPTSAASMASPYRRASHSIEPPMIGSSFTSPVGSQTRSSAMRTHLDGDRAARPTVKQRAVSASGSGRSRPSIAPCSRDTVAGATSSPRDDAFSQLKLYLANSPPPTGGHAPRSPGTGATTPGWLSDSQLPSIGTSRYWTERLTSLAQAMTDELSHVGSAVLGYDARAATPAEPEMQQPNQAMESSAATASEVGGRHERSHSVPLDRRTFASHPTESTLTSNIDAPPASGTEFLVQPKAVTARPADERPKPIQIQPALPTALTHWNSDRDGEAPTRQLRRSRSHRSGRRRAAGSASQDESSSTSSPSFHFHRQEVGEDGHTRIVVVKNVVGRA
ncbi:hypothetical protein BCV70DRAFT_200728 [Testicularia cyperi]|uniref:Uncharacterized protein n=1 Tax=Testicularia cyperi TaxID=1882483 RepID=A0A317XPL9_9BASI|nr:hypothetical protein BCV70DRAFT_200728 [Testicularia cyperi]